MTVTADILSRAHVPEHPIDACLGRARPTGHLDAGDVFDRDRRATFLRFPQVVVDHQPVRFVRHLEVFITIQVEVAEGAEAVVGAWFDAEKVEWLDQDLCRHLLKRRDVADEHATSVGPQHQVVVARVDGQIVHRDGRQVGPQTLPVGPSVDRDPHAQIVADNQEVGILAILHHDVDR